MKTLLAAILSLGVTTEWYILDTPSNSSHTTYRMVEQNVPEPTPEVPKPVQEPIPTEQVVKKVTVFTVPGSLDKVNFQEESTGILLSQGYTVEYSEQPYYTSTTMMFQDHNKTWIRGYTTPRQVKNWVNHMRVRRGKKPLKTFLNKVKKGIFTPVRNHRERVQQRIEMEMLSKLQHSNLSRFKKITHLCK